MKKILALMLAAALLALSGCSAMLERSYRKVSPHEQEPGLSGDSDALEARTYQQLVSAVLYLVSEGVEQGTIRLTDYYDSDIDSALNTACLEVAQEDPLGAYAVDYMEYDYTRVVTSYEAHIRITYRRSRAEIHSLVNVTGAGAIRSELKKALERFAPSTALRVGYFNADEAYIAQLAREAYDDCPASALGMPELDISLYPETGSQRIVEILLTYPDSPEFLAQQRDALNARAEELTAEAATLPRNQRLDALLAVLPASVRQGGGSTAYDALLGSGADSEGTALAVALLARCAGLECSLERGTLNGAPQVWNLVQDGGVWYHLDLSGGEAVLRTGEEQLAAGYLWGDAVPAGPADAEEALAGSAGEKRENPS